MILCFLEKITLIQFLRLKIFKLTNLSKNEHGNISEHGFSKKLERFD